MIKRVGFPKGIKLLTFSTSVRWFGWGLGETLIPYFLLLFSSSFLEAGLLSAVFSIVFLLFLPIAGFLADSTKAKKMIIAGLILYVFIGLGYLFAGLTLMVIFIIIARGLNGISFSMDQLARESYIMRHTHKNKISSVFGRFDYITTFWWILAVVIGIFAVNYIPIHWLLFFIAPTSIISLIIVSNLKEKKKSSKKSNFSFKKVYLENFRQVKNFSPGLKLVSLLVFCLGILSSVIYLFVPISSYLENGSLVQSAILVLVYSIPPLFGQRLGKIADKKKGRVYLFSLFALMIFLVGFTYIHNYYLILVTIFLSSAVLELVSLTNKGMIARLADRAHLAEVDGSLSGISTIGAIVGPIIFGFLMDLYGIKNAYLAMIVITAIISLVIFKGRKNLR